jgi:class 3 adenylate cyclase
VKILVADDNPDSRQLTRDIVASMGHEVVTAVDGPHALATIQEQMPDLVILDVNMPGMSGFDVMTALKADEATAQIPVLMLTALADVENRVHGLGLGADDYLSKPFNPRELVARVNARLRAKGETDDLRATQEMIRSTFERFVAPQVVERLLRDPMQVKLGGTLQEVTILFADLEGFTSISEFTEPEMLLSVLNHYHTLIVNIIQRFGGTIDKFIGDGVMALYNTPLPQKDHALRAVRTALQIREALPKFYEDFEPEYQMRINFGIHTGMAVVGNVGTPQIMDFTAVGDTVNLAARLQDISDEGQILISLSTYEQVADHVAVQPVGYLDIKGRKEPVMAYTVSELAR